MRDEIRRLALFTTGVAELTRHRAEQVVRDMVHSGDVRREQASSLVRELLERNRQNRQELIDLMRGEIRRQVEGLGLASSRDLERLERRVARLESATKPTTGTRKGAGARKTTGGTSSRTKTTRPRRDTKPAGTG